MEAHVIAEVSSLGCSPVSFHVSSHCSAYVCAEKAQILR